MSGTTTGSELHALNIAAIANPNNRVRKPRTTHSIASPVAALRCVVDAFRRKPGHARRQISGYRRRINAARKSGASLRQHLRCFSDKTRALVDEPRVDLNQI